MKLRALLALALLVSCRSNPPQKNAPAGDAGRSAQAVPVFSALLPARGRGAPPSLAKLPSDDAGVDGEYLADVSSCGSCHPDLLAQQQASAHAFASFNNPIYRLAVERLRAESGKRASHSCAGCHDAALLIDGAMDHPVGPDDVRAHNGVSCRLCHGIASATRDGNGSYELRAQPLPLPVSGDPQSLAAHKKAARPPEVAELCGSCHQSFLSPASGNALFLAGQSELLNWADSAYAGAGSARVDEVVTKSCVACHMPKVSAPLGDAAANGEGAVSSHYFLGSHTWLAAMRGDKAQLQRAQSFLLGVATVDALSEVSALEGSPDLEQIAIEIVVRNTGVGHRFPAGVRDVANTWIEVEVLTEKGRVLLESTSRDSVHRLSALVADEDGVVLELRETHRFTALVADHTIAPRDVALVRYRGRLPRGHRAAVVRTRLLHQSRGQALVAATCAEVRSERGRAWARARRKLERLALDGCRAAPVTLIAEVTREVGDQGGNHFARSYERGLGLLHEVQERVDMARSSLDRALVLAGDDGRLRAMALQALATLEARLGRADKALALLGRAGTLAPKSASIPATRGDALSRVWRWPEAAEAYGKATKLADGNASLWRRYAVALGSAGLQEDALRAAQRGLQLLPRDVHLLRVQALALRSLGSEDAAAAMEAYLQHRGLDNVGNLRLRCASQSAHCARESVQVHEHELSMPTP